MFQFVTKAQKYLDIEIIKLRCVFKIEKKEATIVFSPYTKKHKWFEVFKRAEIHPEDCLWVQSDSQSVSDHMLLYYKCSHTPGQHVLKGH